MKALAFFLIIAIIAFFVARQHLLYTATQNADAYIMAADDNTPIAIGMLVHDRFIKKKHAGPWAPLAPLRPILTNTLLPDFIRLPDGALEMMYQSGWCDEHVRALQFILARHGINSEQWNIIAPHGSHSVLTVMPGNADPYFIDPYYGGYAQDNAQRLSLSELQKRVADTQGDAKPYTSIAFYRNLDQAAFAPQGADLTIETILPALSAPTAIGEIDHHSRDVFEAAEIMGLKSVWSYLGHKYDRGWVRILTAAQPITLCLTPVGHNLDHVLPTLSPPPAQKNGELCWTLEKNGTITMKDALAKRNWTRLNSYVPVDKITITPR